MVGGAAADRRFFFFFNDTATTEIYTLSLHDALPIYGLQLVEEGDRIGRRLGRGRRRFHGCRRGLTQSDARGGPDLGRRLRRLPFGGGQRRRTGSGRRRGRRRGPRARLDAADEVAHAHHQPAPTLSLITSAMIRSSIVVAFLE